LFGVYTYPAPLERIGASGTLAQMIRDHLVAGGTDPRVETAAKLADSGVILQRQVRKALPTPCRGGGGANASMLYANFKCSEDARIHDVYGSREVCRAAWKSYHLEFRLLPASERQLFEEKAASLRRPHADSSHGDHACMPTSRRTIKANFGLATAELPISSDAFVAAASGHAAPDSNLAFRAWGPAARDELIKDIFVEDNNCIPGKKKFTEILSCRQMHFGICRTDDVDVYDVYTRCGNSLWQFAWAEDLEHSWCALQVCERDTLQPIASCRIVVAYLANLRGADPRRVVFFQGQLCALNATHLPTQSLNTVAS
jgi:hypothetical protein